MRPCFDVCWLNSTTTSPLSASFLLHLAKTTRNHWRASLANIEGVRRSRAASTIRRTPSGCIGVSDQTTKSKPNLRSLSPLHREHRGNRARDRPRRPPRRPPQALKSSPTHPSALFTILVPQKVTMGIQKSLEGGQERRQGPCRALMNSQITLGAP